ncbi:MAG: hypothetical protein K0R58_2904 [Ramlibacter sp.]|jgi:hypothetical protein|nr:hypothetical protein [Ramlibacter sp.]
MPMSARARGSALTWQQCGACTRCWQFELVADGCIVAKGDSARKEFRTSADHASSELAKAEHVGTSKMACRGRAAGEAIEERHR